MEYNEGDHKKIIENGADTLAKRILEFINNALPDYYQVNDKYKDKILDAMAIKALEKAIKDINGLK